MVIERGEGCYVWDADGNRYLDGLAGLFCTNLGHGRSDLAAAAAKQMDKLGFYPNWGFAHPSAIEAASMIAAVAPGDLDRVFFVSSRLRGGGVGPQVRPLLPPGQRRRAAPQGDRPGAGRTTAPRSAPSP